MPPNRYETDRRDSTTAPHRQVALPPPTSEPSRRRQRLADGSSPPTQVNLRPKAHTDGLDAVVAGLLGRAASARAMRSTQMPEPLAVALEGSRPGPAMTPIAPLPQRRRGPFTWFFVALVVAGAGVAASLSLLP